MYFQSVTRWGRGVACLATAVVLGGCQTAALVGTADPAASAPDVLQARALPASLVPASLVSADDVNRALEERRLFRSASEDGRRAVPAAGGAYFVGGPGDAPEATASPVTVSVPTLNSDDMGASPATGTPSTRTPRRRRLFPLLGDKVESRGHELPYPVGGAVGYFFTERRMEITKLDVSFGGTPIDTSFVTVDPYSRASAWEAKVDLWVLPFLNVYGFYGRLSTNTKTTVTIPNPLPGPPRPDISFQIPTKLDGDTRGGGIVLAGGYKGWFASINANYSKTELGFEDEIDANVNSLRLGRHEKFGKAEVALWVGGVYWNMKKTVNGVVPVQGVGDIAFDVDYEPVEPFNLMVGTHITIDKRFEIVCEYGFWEEVTTFLIQGGFRL